MVWYIAIKYSFICSQLNSPKTLYVIIVINIIHLLAHSWIVPGLENYLIILFDPMMGNYQVLQLQFRMDLGLMVMKGWSTFLKAPELKPHHQMQFSVISWKFVGVVLSLYRDAVGVFYWPSWLVYIYIYIYIYI